MRRGILLAVGAGVLLAAGYGASGAFWRGSDAPGPAAAPAAPGRGAGAVRAPAPSSASVSVPGKPAGVAEGDGLRRVPVPAVDTRTPAWLALAQAREGGDARTPPLQREAPVRQADPAVLADHEAYAAHELAQKQRLAAAYAHAAAPELARLHADLELGREAGVPPHELAKVAEKIRRIEQQRRAAEAALSAGPSR